MFNKCQKCGGPLIGELVMTNHGMYHGKCLNKVLDGAHRLLAAVFPEQHPPVPDPEPDVDDYYDDPIERPYCDECGSTLVTAEHCYAFRCNRKHEHCPNTNCGASPHCGEDWI